MGKVSGPYRFDNRYALRQKTIVEFTDGDTTPSIDNAVNSVFKTANAGATPITQFDDLANNVGTFTVLFGDGNTAIVHDGANIILMGGAGQFDGKANDIMFFLNDGTKVYEITQIMNS